MLRVDDIRDLLTEKWLSEDYTNGTIELVGESFVADVPTIFGKPNDDYVERELQWYRSGSLYVNDIPGGAPKIWQQISSSTGKINSNYGHLLLSPSNGNQLSNVIIALMQDPGSRRATAIYTRPTMHSDWNAGGMQDFVCTNAVQYLIRNDELMVIVQMRSNDVVFGYRNDYAWQRYIQELIVSTLRGSDKFEQLRPGRIIWHAASLHVYERHFWMLEHYNLTGEFDPVLK